MNKIPTIYYEDIYEFCDVVDAEFSKRHYSAKKNDSTVDISIVAKYDMARKLINTFVDYGYEIACMDFHDPEYDGYEDEYIISLCYGLSDNKEMEIWCEPAKRGDDYLILGGDVFYILDECNSKIVPKVESNNVYFIELQDEIEDEYDDFADDLECGNCEECHIFDDSDDEENAKDDVYATVELTPEESQILDMLYHAFGLLKYVV